MVPEAAVRWCGGFLAALAMGSAACGVMLGDFPEGKLKLEADGGVVLPDEAPEGSICSVANADILDLKIDSTDIFWLRATTSEGGRRFAVEACSKKGGAPRPIATVSKKPEALALSEQYVFWSINDASDASGGVWRGSKAGGPQEQEAFVKVAYAGPIHVANGTLYTGARAGVIHANSPDTGASSAEGIPNIGDPASIAVSDAHLYWSDRDTHSISTAPRQGTVLDVGFVPGSPSPRSLLAFDRGALHWATIGAAGATLESKCPAPCETKTIATLPNGFAAFAVRNGNVYWTANEDGAGVVRRCTDLAGCESRPASFWSSANTVVSHIALDDSDVYFAASRGADSYIVKSARGR